MRKGYVIVLLDVADQDRYVEYAKRATQIEDRYGGRALVVSDSFETIEGEWPAERVVVLEFPSIGAAHSWYADPEYQKLIPLRRQATDSNIIFCEGFLPE